MQYLSFIKLFPLILQYNLSKSKVQNQMTTLPVDLASQVPQKNMNSNNYILRQYNLTLKKAPAIINAKKLPKDFFGKQKMQETRSTKKVFKVLNQQFGGSQKVPKVKRNFISQNGINLNQFHAEEIPEAQVTSFFGFADSEKSQNHRSGTSDQERKNLMEKPFDDLKIKYECNFEAKSKNQESTLNSTPFMRGKYQKYIQNAKISAQKTQEKCCSIELNCQKQNFDNNKTTQEQEFDESLNRFTFHNPKGLMGNRSTMLDCTFAICQTDVQQDGSEHRKNERRGTNKSTSIFHQGRTEANLRKKKDFKQSLEMEQKFDLNIRREKGRSVQLKRKIATERHELQKNTNKNLNANSNPIVNARKQSVQKIRWKNNCESRQIQKIHLPPISSRGH